MSVSQILHSHKEMTLQMTFIEYVIYFSVVQQNLNCSNLFWKLVILNSTDITAMTNEKENNRYGAFIKKDKFCQYFKFLHFLYWSQTNYKEIDENDQNSVNIWHSVSLGIFFVYFMNSFPQTFCNNIKQNWFLFVFILTVEVCMNCT